MMVTRWGMSDALGMVQLVESNNPYLNGMGGSGRREFSEETAKLIDHEVHKIINDCHQEAKRLLNENRMELDSLAAALMDKETLDEKEILLVTGLRHASELVNEKILV
jgi:cell division protease FtsH